MKSSKAMIVTVLCVLMNALPAQADPLSGVRSLVLTNASGGREVIGQVVFAPLGDGRSTFKVTLDSRLEEYFLAMRPFRCLTGPTQRLCSFPVEREPQVVSGEAAAPLFRELAVQSSAPRWNFYKYVVGRDGKVIASFSSLTKPDDAALIEAIDKAIAQP